MNPKVINATFRCNFCEEPAGTITIAPKGIPLPYEAGPAPFQGDIMLAKYSDQ